MAEVYASLLGAVNIGATLEKLEKAGADGVQLDVMDGKYNSNSTWDAFNPDNVRAIKSSTKLPLEVHLMIEEPWNSVVEFCESCETVIFHYETCSDEKVKETVRKIKMSGRKAGIAIEPETHFSLILPFLQEIDVVLVMTVRTGYAGQKFTDRSSEIKELSDYRKKSGLKYLIEVDGGINGKTARIATAAGADRLVSASFILNSQDFSRALKALRGA